LKRGQGELPNPSLPPLSQRGGEIPPLTLRGGWGELPNPTHLPFFKGEELFPLFKTGLGGVIRNSSDYSRLTPSSPKRGLGGVKKGRSNLTFKSNLQPK